VVDLALASSVPIIHIAIDREGANVTTRLLVGGHALEPITMSLESDALDGLLRGTLRPKPKPAVKKPRAARRPKKKAKSAA